MKRVWQQRRSLVVAMVMGCALVACNSSTSTAPPVAKVTYAGTQSPGDLWTATFNSDGTFTASNTYPTRSVSFSGTTQALASGFTKLTVTSSNSSDVVVGAVGYAFQFPGTAIFMKPPGNSVGIPSITDPDTANAPTTDGTNPNANYVSGYNTKSVFLVAQDSSATVGTGDKLNWVDFPNESWTAVGSNAWGQGVVGNPTTTIPLTVTEFLLDGSQQTFDINNLPQGCSVTTGILSCIQNLTPVGSGQATVTSGTPTGTCGTSNQYVINTFQISPSGAFMGDQTTPNCTGQLSVAGFLGMKAPSATVDTASLFGVARNFRGVLFRAKSVDSPFTEEIFASIDPFSVTPNYLVGG